MGRRLRRIALYVGLCQIGLVTAALLVLHCGPFRAWVATRASAAIAGAAGVDVAIGAVDYNLLAARVAVRDLRIGAKSGARPAVAIGELAVALPARVFLGRFDRVTSVEVRGLEIAIGRAADGRWTLPLLELGEDAHEAPGTPARPFVLPPFRIDHAALEATHLSFDDRSLPLSVMAEDAAVEVSYDAERGAHAVELSIGSVSVRTGDGGAQAQGVVELHARVTGNRVSLDHLAVKTSFATAEVTGAIDDLSRLGYRAEARLSLDLAEVAKSGAVLGLPPDLTGTATLRAQVAGDPVAVEASGELAAEGVGVAGLQAMAVQGTLHFDGETLELGKARITGPAFAVGLEAALALSDTGAATRPALRGHLAIERLSGPALDAAIGPIGGGLATDATGHATFAMARYSLETLTADIDVELSEAVSVPAPDAVGSAGALRARGNLTARIAPTTPAPRSDLLMPPIALSGKRLWFRDLEVGELTATVAVGTNAVGAHGLRIAGPHGRIEGTATVPIAEDGQLVADLSLAGANPSTLRDLIGEVPLDGELAATITARGTLAVPDLVAVVTAPSLVASGEPLRDLRIEAVLAGTRAVLRQCRVDLSGGGSVAASGEYDLATEKMSLRAEARAVKLAAVRALTGSMPELQGELNADASAAGTATELRGDLSLAATDVRLAPAAAPAGPISLGARYAYASGALRVDGLSLSVPGVSATASAALPLSADTPGVDRLAARLDADVRLETVWSALAAAKILPDDLSLALDGAIFVEARREPAGPGLLDGLSIDATFHDVSAAASPAAPIIESLRGKLSLAAGAVLIDAFTGRLGGSAFRLAGTIPLAALPVDLPVPPPPGPQTGLDVSLALDAVALSSLVPLGDIPADAVVAAALHLGGRRLDPEALTAELVLSRLEGRYEKLNVRNDGDVRLRLEGGVLRIEHLSLVGPGTSIVIGGGADIGHPQESTLGLVGSASIDAGTLSAYAPGLGLRGRIDLAVQVAGSPAAPQLSGQAILSDLVLTPRAMEARISHTNGRVDFAGDTVHISKLQGRLGAGSFDAAGQVTLGAGGVQNAAVDLALNGVTARIPPGVRLAADGKLRWVAERALSPSHLTGSVSLRRGLFTEPFDLDVAYLLGLLKSGAPTVAQELSILDTMKLDLAVSLGRGFRVRNNLGNLLATGDLRVTGSATSPLVSGDVTLGKGGEIYFSQQTYHIVRGKIELVASQPHFDIEAYADPDDKRQGREGQPERITIRFSGTLDSPEVDLDAPGMDKAQAAAALLTGSKDAGAGGASGYAMLAAHMGAYFAGRGTADIESKLAKTLRLSLVRIEPELVAAQESRLGTDPGARLTVGKSVLSSFFVGNSTNLTNSSYQLWWIDWNGPAGLTGRLVRDEDEQLIGDLRFEKSLNLLGRRRAAGEVGPGQEAPPTIRRILFEGDRPVATWRLRWTLQSRRWAALDELALQDDADALRKLLRKRGYREAVVEVETRPAGERRGRPRVDVVFKLEPGPLVAISLQSDVVELPVTLEKDLENLWDFGFSDDELVAEGSERISDYLRTLGYDHATVTADVSTSPPDAGPAAKQVTYHAAAGTRSTVPAVHIQGATLFSEEQLVAALAQELGATNKDLAQLVLADPRSALGTLQALYAQTGYLHAQLDGPRLMIASDGRREVLIEVAEGKQTRVRRVELCGAKSFSSAELSRQVYLGPGLPYTPAAFVQTRSALTGFYHARGFLEARTSAEMRQTTGADPCSSPPTPPEGSATTPPFATDGALVDAVYTVAEGTRAMVEAIDIRGNTRTPDWIIARELEIAPGDPLEEARMTRSERKLRLLRLFDRVEVTSEPLGTDGRRRIIVFVEERPAQRVALGARYGSDEGAEGTLELQGFNIAGTGLGTSLRLLANDHQQDTRFALDLLPVLAKKLKTTAFLQLAEQDDPGLFQRWRGWTVQQKIAASERIALFYNYNYRRTRIREKESTGPFPFDLTVSVGRITLGLVADGRDDPWDPKKGYFGSATVEYSADFLDSDLPFLKFFGHGAAYLALPRKLTLGVALRAGVARPAHDQILLGSERFKAGGESTVRGYERDTLGPRSRFTDVPVGGEGMFVANTELRIPVYSIASAVLFVDAGEVYAEYQDVFSLDLRYAGGFGVRAQTPLGLVRGDIAWKLHRREGESPYEFYVGLGHAF
ncbi:MAG: translocation/assembly module TamB domain-containing protein [Candidatus Schekmanbacteria bacterium]|nr:translocation/assembly module TamB domain-containing protein [Candidatus Schekmanbacteria bacterium]